MAVRIEAPASQVAQGSPGLLVLRCEPRDPLLGERAIDAHSPSLHLREESGVADHLGGEVGQAGCCQPRVEICPKRPSIRHVAAGVGRDRFAW